MVDLALPVRTEQVFMVLIATGECALMRVVQRLADASRKMGVGRGNDHSLWGCSLVLNFHNSSEGMFGFAPGLFIAC
jgi:hypothetical protein